MGVGGAGREGARTMSVLGGIGKGFSISLLVLPEQEGKSCKGDWLGRGGG